MCTGRAALKSEPWGPAVFSSSRFLTPLSKIFSHAVENTCVSSARLFRTLLDSEAVADPTELVLGSRLACQFLGRRTGLPVWFYDVMKPTPSPGRIRERSQHTAGAGSPRTRAVSSSSSHIIVCCSKGFWMLTCFKNTFCHFSKKLLLGIFSWILIF